MKKSEKISEINNRLSVAIAEEKTKLAKAELEYRERVTVLMAQAQIKREEAADDPDEPQDNNKPTQWLNGEQWSAAVTARRIINRLPKIPYNCAIGIDIQHYNKGAVSLAVKAYNPSPEDEKFVSLYLAGHMEDEEQAAYTEKWLEDIEKHFSVEADDEHAFGLNAMFGGNPIDEIPTIREEAGNE